MIGSEDRNPLLNLNSTKPKNDPSQSYVLLIQQLMITSSPDAIGPIRLP